MQIRRLKTTSDEELINHIKNGLADHEEEYAVGSWENFNKKEGKRPAIIVWMGGIGAAAAVLLIGFALFFYQNNKKDIVNSGIAQTAPLAPEQPALSGNDNNSIVNAGVQPQPTEKGNIAKASITPQKEAESKIVELTLTSPVTDIQTPTNPVISGNIAIKQADPVAVVTTDPTSPGAKKPITLDAFLAKENEMNASKKPSIDKQALNNKWDLGVVVAPSFGNTDRLNMGYGVSMAYNINSKVSVGSGVSYNEMGASKDIIGNSAPNSPSANALVNDTKSLESVNTRVTGIDIPLEVRYNLSSRFYANVGVSAFAVINQQQNNVYLQGTVVQGTTLNLAGDVQPQSFLRTEKVSEKATETLSPNSRLIGFYNFSFGYKQKLSKDKSVGIEPFIKVPMKDVTKENLRLLGTGLKIKFDF